MKHHSNSKNKSATNTMAMQSKSPTFTTVQNTVAEVISIDPEEVTLNMELDEINVLDIPKIVAKLNKDLGLTLSAKLVLTDCETISDLVMLVEDEQEFEAF